ncbi:putative ATP-dependent DNA helicase DinG [Oscillatoria nigro-viridis PCC 7112]|uniref:Putative ATP-dependent DNA helicase DinG n=1 Tax=Phormidium nigroviride PCC 7112 TaxID=179408 RepID=K9VLX5_9CYAN|nr:helicase C-terminal domain-containing protein [Oscillatoria nigro-viridis]AFZ08492.1 putative ATP-dependent DNA helicase DinG [Oscillatoria nigro-viridis PCC 7112]
MIEVEVHNSLLRFLRSNSEPHWPHHLTMARLVARALRLGRSALIQTGLPAGAYRQRYRVSYLMPILMWPEPVILVAPKALLEHLQAVEIPRLQEWLQTDKSIEIYSDKAAGRGLMLADPESWLAARLAVDSQLHSNIPTIIDGVDDLEVWTRQQLTACLQPADWNDLMQSQPLEADAILQGRVMLTRAFFRHPAKPEECYLLETAEQKILEGLFERIEPNSLIPAAWSNFWQRWEANGKLRWAEINREAGSFSLYCAPVQVAEVLGKIWEDQPVVLIGGAVDLEPKAPIFRQMMGLPELTSVKFSPDRQSELIQLYIPNWLPLPNTPEFQGVLIEEIRTLLLMSASVAGLTVLIVGDVPLKARLAAILAAEFGSRVQVEKTDVGENAILVTGWEFWREHQGELSAPHLLAIATLPLPSLENPLVTARVAYYKERRKDWFRLYLLPAALNELQRAIAPVRERQGVVAIFDSRVIHRSYGKQVLGALSPFARIDYLDTTWLTQA